MAYTNSTLLNVKYGSDPLQFVNVYQTLSTTPLGTIFRIHGGGWNSGDGPVSVFPSSTVEDPNMVILSQAGYAVVDVNYRGKNNDGGAFPTAILDVMVAFGACLSLDEATTANSFDPNWTNIYNYIKTTSLMVSGISAGGYLAIAVVGLYGQGHGVWPKLMLNISGPLNVDYTAPNSFAEPFTRSIIDTWITATDLSIASPIALYGNAANPGTWFDIFNKSPCQFAFVLNYNDTLVPRWLIEPMVVTMIANMPTNAVSAEILHEGPEYSDFDGLTSLNQLGTLASTSLLPTTNNKLGDSWIIGDFYWVYNNGTYIGDSLNPASVSGFTRWFSHNYTTPESTIILRYANQAFGKLNISIPNVSTKTYFNDYKLPSTVTNNIYAQQLYTSGGVAPYTYTYFGDVFPKGLGISSYGLLSGIPSMPGYYRFSIQSTDANGAIAFMRCQLTITSSIPIPRVPMSMPVGDSFFNGNHSPKNTFYTVQTPGIGAPAPAVIGAENIITNRNMVYIVDEIYWGTSGSKLAGVDVQAMCDYYRLKGMSPGIGIVPAAELVSVGGSVVPMSTILTDALRCDWVLLDPYLFTVFVAPFNNGDSTINDVSITNTINGLIAWTQKWIDTLAPYGIRIILTIQGIVEPSLDPKYVQQYLQAQYSTFDIATIPHRIVFTMISMYDSGEINSWNGIDVTPYINNYPIIRTRQLYPKILKARTTIGQLYPRTK